MTWIKTVLPDEAEGSLKTLYDEGMKRAGFVSSIVKSMSLNPPLLRSSIMFYSAVMFGESPLSRVQKELLAVVVASELQCHY